jgi:hypothetical protein
LKIHGGGRRNNDNKMKNKIPHHDSNSNTYINLAGFLVFIEIKT